MHGGVGLSVEFFCRALGYMYRDTVLFRKYLQSRYVIAVLVGDEYSVYFINARAYRRKSRAERACALTRIDKKSSLPVAYQGGISRRARIER